MKLSALASLFCFCVIGLGASAEDWRRSQVANRWILAGLAAAILIYFALGANTLIGFFKTPGAAAAIYLKPIFYLHAGIHAALAAAAAIAFWHWRVWPAGDAKLYFTLVLLLPLVNFGLWGFPYLLFLTSLINIFMAAAIFVLAVLSVEWSRLAWKYLRGPTPYKLYAIYDLAAKRAADEWKKRGNYARAGWNVFVIFFLIQFLSQVAPKEIVFLNNPLVDWVLIYLLWMSLGPFLIRKSVAARSLAIFAIFTIAAFFLLRQDFRGLIINSFWETVGFGVFLPIMRRFVDYYLIETRKIPIMIHQLKEGMILSRKSWDELVAWLNPGDNLVAYADGVSKEDILWIQERGAALGDARREIAVCRHRPFAFWIFAGCIWTLYNKENLALWLTSRICLH